MPKFYVDNAKNRKLHRVGKPYQMGGVLPEDFYPNMIRLFSGNSKMLQPQFPTKEVVLDKLKKWQAINCLPYKSGKVMIIDDAIDTHKVSKCPLFTEHKRIQKDILYQFILYETGKDRQLLLVPAYSSPEIGTKHNCLVDRLPRRSKLIASGELLRRDDVVIYSCMSSLFFSVLWEMLFPNLLHQFRARSDGIRSGNKMHNNFKEYYESESVKLYLKSVIPKCCSIMYVENIEDTAKPNLDPRIFCDLPEQDRPDCLRYMHNDTCEIGQNHPTGDCTLGIDFCSNMDRDNLDPDVIPSERFIHEHRRDPDKAAAFLKKHGRKPNPKGYTYYNNITMATALAKELKLTEQQTIGELYSLKQKWP